MNHSINYMDGKIHELLDRDAGTVIFEAASMIVITFGAFVGNLILCLVIWKSSSLHTLTNLYIMTLAVSDIFMAGTCMVMSTDVLIHGKWRFGHLTCQVYGFLFFVLGYGNLQMNGLIAINRYFCVVKPSSYRKYFKRTYAWGMVCLLWAGTFAMVTIIVAIPLLHFVFRPDRFICFAKFHVKKIDVVFAVFTSVFYIIGPLVVMVISYWEIHKVLKVHNANISNNQHGGRDNQLGGRGENRTRLSAEETRITKVLCALVFCYIMCMIPVVVIHYIEVSLPAFLPRQAQMLYSYFYFLNNGLHPLIYGVLNKPFRTEFARLFLGRFSASRVDQAPADTEPGTSNMADNILSNSNKWKKTENVAFESD